MDNLTALQIITRELDKASGEHEDECSYVRMDYGLCDCKTDVYHAVEHIRAVLAQNHSQNKYPVLQAAATIYSNSLIKPFDTSQNPLPHYWENTESSVDQAIALLAEIEKRNT